MTKIQIDRIALIARRSKRAAIREYDGGKKRVDAERLALDDVADVVLRQNTERRP